MSRAGRRSCAEPGCEKSIPDHYWGRVKDGDGWFQQRNGDVWCPDHIPGWVEAWRQRRDARMIDSNNCPRGEKR